MRHIIQYQPQGAPRPYRVCTRCVMDTTDPDISFDAEGRCNHCVRVEGLVGRTWFPTDGQERLDDLVARIKTEGAGKRYDCMIGLSGGVDSSYLAYVVVKELGLRPLAVHVDAGWNSEIAVHNIEQIVRRLDIDLETEVIDWPTIRDLQCAYLKSGVTNQDVPQDHAFVRALFHNAKRHGIKYFLSGSNLATESILPERWGGDDALDGFNIRAIYKRFGEHSLQKYKTLNFLEYYILMPFIYRIRMVRPLNLMPYNRQSAIELISKELGWKSYGEKHHESRWTKYFQTYYLVMKLGFDKRRAHYSSLVVSGQMTRDEALKRLEGSAFDPAAIELDQEFVMKKLGMGDNAFFDAVNAPFHRHQDYPNRRLLNAIKEWGKRVSGIRGTL
jgi:N-acetyl sugar amidotransferase